MALKFRRGDASQKSGSLQFGEPFVNTSLNTLQVGGASGDITLATTGENASFVGLSVSASTFISASELHVTGNAEIRGDLVLGGTIIVGDNTADNIVINADLSSSIIPNNDNAFNLGSSIRRYSEIYGVNIFGAINATNGVVSGSSQVVGILSELNSYTSSNNTTNDNQNNRLSALETASGSSINRLNALETASGSAITRLNALEIETANLESFTSSINTTIKTQLNANTVVSGSSQINYSGISNIPAGIVSGAAQVTPLLPTGTVSGSSQVVGILSSLNSYTQSNDTTNTTQNSRLDQLSTASGSAINRLNALETNSGSVNTSITNLNSFSSSQLSKDATLATYTGSNDTKWSTLGSLSGSFARTDINNSFSGLQTFNNINVNGTASFAYIQSTTGSATSIGEAFIILNENTPSSNYAGIKVVDSGSSFTTASFVYDGLNNQWVFEKAGPGSDTGSSVAIFGPVSGGGLGTEVGLTQNKIPKAVTTHGHHIADSQITDDGTTVTIAGALSVVGSITGSIAATNGVVSGSSQVVGILAELNSYTQSNDTTNTAQNARLTSLETVSGSAIGRLGALEQNSASVNTSVSNLNSFTSSINTTIKAQLDANTVVSGSSQVVGILTSLNSYTASNDTTNTAQNARLTSLETASGSAIGRLNNLETFTSSINTTIKTQLNANTVISGSSQVTGITNGQLANSAITIAGTSTSLGGSITLATITGASGIISGSSQISGLTTSNLSGTAGITNGQLANSAITIAGTSTSLGGSITLATITGGSGIVSGSSQIDVASTTGDIALGTRTSGNYVATITAGTGVSSTGATTGEGTTHTISIGQAVATTSNVRFGSIGVGMDASGTSGRIDAANDIVAFSSSDIRFKENITPIENPIEKIRKISGNTYDWKAENKEFHGYEGNDVGVIAQEIEAVLPQLVQTRENGFKAVKYDKLVALLIEGIKEQQLQIEQLRIDLNNCKNNKGL